MQHAKDVAQVELEEMKRYATHIEGRYKEMSDAEETANRKVLKLLDDVSRLTKENQELIRKLNEYRAKARGESN